MAGQTKCHFVLPGMTIPENILPISSDSNRSLKLGAGVRVVEPSEIRATLAGYVWTDSRKNAVWVENNNKRYLPSPGDLVIATVVRSAAEQFVLTLVPNSPTVTLDHMSFEGVTKKTRPQLDSGATVYARVLSADKYMDTELVCFNPATGKSEGLGELKEGMVFDISLRMARRLLFNKVKEQGGVLVLDLLAEKINFETAVGRNGKIWVDAGSVEEIMAIGEALRETDQKILGLDAQRKLVEKLLRELGKG